MLGFSKIGIWIRSPLSVIKNPPKTIVDVFIVAVCHFDQGAAVEGAGVGFLKNLVLNILFQMKERSSEKPNTVSDDLLIVGFSTRPTVPNDFQIKIKKYLLTHLQPYLEALDHLALNVVKK